MNPTEKKPENEPRRGRPRRPGQLIHPRIGPDLYSSLMAYCARRRVTATAVVVTALRQYLDQGSDATLVMRRLDRLNRRVARVRREVELVTEFLSVWSRLWFAHTPQLPAADRAAANQSAAKRYEQMVEYLSKQLTGSHRLATELFGEELEEEPGGGPSSEGQA